MRYPIFFAMLLGVATPLAAQDDADYGGRAVAVTDKITLTGGEEIYRGVCQGCHQSDGSGAEGAGDYPALAGNQNLEYPEYAIYLVVNGQRAMPPFGDLLDDEQIAAVVRFVQTHWGNEAEDEASAELVEDARP
jgi:mono/diheme cytochrome c family protein